MDVLFRYLASDNSPGQESMRRADTLGRAVYITPRDRGDQQERQDVMGTPVRASVELCV